MLGQAVLRRDPPVDQAARVARAALHRHPSAEPAPPDYSTPAGMRRAEFRAMGTTISLLLPENQAELGLQIVRSLVHEDLKGEFELANGQGVRAIVSFPKWIAKAE